MGFERKNARFGMFIDQLADEKLQFDFALFGQLLHVELVDSIQGCRDDFDHRCVAQTRCFVFHVPELLELCQSLECKCMEIDVPDSLIELAERTSLAQGYDMFGNIWLNLAALVFATLDFRGSARFAVELGTDGAVERAVCAPA